MEVPRLGVELELQLLAYATATAMPDLELHLRPTPQLMAILDPDSLSEAKDPTQVATSWIRFCCTTMGTPSMSILFRFLPLISLYIEYSSLCYIHGLCRLSILYAELCIYLFIPSS